MTLVLKVNCRACTRECGDYKHLMDETVIDDESTTLAALLHYCTSLECFVEDEGYSMPEHICNSCVEHLLQSYLFKEMVLQNDRAYRERFKAEAEENKAVEVVKVVGAEEYVEQEIDVGGTLEENREEFIVDTEENIEITNRETEYEMEEWLEIDEASESAITEVVACEDTQEESILPDSIGKSDIKEEHGDEKISSYEIVDEDGDFIITTSTEEVENDSDSGEVLRGFEENDDFKEGENHIYEIQDLEIISEEKDIKKIVKKRNMKANGLTEADLTCQYCGKLFDKMCRLREHSYMHTGEKPHVCKICGKRSRTKTHYNVHMLTHSEEKRYKCTICGQNYRTSTSLRVHERKHSNIRPYACDLCDKTFHTYEQKKLHHMLHTGERPFSCETCGKSYRENHSLKLHLQSHEDKKPYQCEVCGKGLTQMSGYKRHMLLHTNEYPHKCDICDRPFRISSNLVAHRRLHLNILPYQCTICTKGFNNSTRLKRHMLQHEPKVDVFKPRKPRQDAIIVESRVAKSNVVEII